MDILVGSFSRVTSHWQSVPSVLAVTSSKADPRPDMLIEYTGCLCVVIWKRRRRGKKRRRRRRKRRGRKEGVSVDMLIEYTGCLCVIL